MYGGNYYSPNIYTLAKHKNLLMKNVIPITLAWIVFCFGCGNKIKINEDKVYSRHLQKQVELIIISTPVPSDKSDFNLLILNDGQDLEKLRAKTVVDSLWKKKLIKPLLVVGIKASDRQEIYGVTGIKDYQDRGKSTEKYSKFINNELLAYIKKMAGVRKFNSVTFAGNTLGGLSAFDISWDNWQKIDKVGAFSGLFDLSNLNPVDPKFSKDKNNILLSKVTSSRKRPKLKYWFYAGKNENSTTKKELSNEQKSTKDLIELILKRKVCSPGDIVYIDSPGENNYAAWSQVFPEFLIWAVGR
jgi:enterochelin esterase-like enzyme